METPTKKIHIEEVSKRDAKETRSLLFVHLPDDIISNISELLPFYIRMMLALVCNAITGAIWRSCSSITNINCDQINEIMRSIARQPHLLAKLTHITPKLPILCRSLDVELLNDIANNSKLEQVTLEDQCTNGCLIFLSLVQSTAPLKRVEILCGAFNFDAVTVADVPINESLTYLNLGMRGEKWGANRPSCAFQACLARWFPRLVSLFIPDDSLGWYALKSLNDLTHLYISLPTQAHERIFRLRTIEDVEKSCQMLVEMTPLKVGTNLVVRQSDRGLDFATILETLLQSGSTVSHLKEKVEMVVHKYNYKLDFTHRLLQNQPYVGGVVDYCRLNLESYRIIFLNVNMPFFVGPATRSKSKCSTFYDVFTTVINLAMNPHLRVEILQVAFGDYWNRALMTGHNPAELLSGNSELSNIDSPLFDWIEHIDATTLNFILSRPDVFGNLQTLRDCKGRSLLAMESKVIPELLKAGLDWRQVDNNGISALDWLIRTADPKRICSVIDSMTDDELAQAYTPFMCAGLARIYRGQRFLRVVPIKRLPQCIKAALDSSLISKSKYSQVEFRFLPKPLMHLVAEAWLSPVDWELFYPIYENTNELVGMTTAHLAYLNDPTGKLVADTFDMLVEELDLVRAMKWVTAKDNKGESISVHFKVVLRKDNDHVICAVKV